MSTIDIHISGIGRDCNGNLIGRLVACQDCIVIADSGPHRHQLHGNYREAARSWLASCGITTDEHEGGIYWIQENTRHRVVDARVRLLEIRS